MAGSFTGGAGGLFSGLAQGLQLLVALRNAEADRQLRERNTAEAERRGAHDIAMDEASEERKPFEDIQTQINKRNVVASLGDVRREYTPPAVGDTFQPTNKFAPPEFNAAAPQPTPSFGQQSGPPSPVPNLNTSHIAQVLERAQRRTGHDYKMSALDAALTGAEQQAQQTQLPVSEGLPSGFEAQPDKTFTPYQLSGRPDPLDNIFGPLLNNPVNAKILQKTDPITYQQFEAWKARRIGGGGTPPGGGGGNPGTPSAKTADQHIQDVLQEHPSWTDQQVADEVRRRMSMP